MTTMPGRFRARAADAWRLVAHSLSGRLLLLTLFYVMLSEALIFLPAIGRYHRSLLDTHIESAEIAILPFTELGNRRLSAGLRGELVRRVDASAVILRRPEKSELYLPEQMPEHVDVTIDLRDQNLLRETAQALACLFDSSKSVLHVIASTRVTGARTIELFLDEKTIRAQLIAYSRNVLALGLVISIATALLVFWSLFLVLVRPMRRITHAMIAFRENPEDASRIVSPSARNDEIGVAERELAVMQREIYGFLQQKARLAALGTAVAKIQHDLKNILTSAQLASDRLARIDDPVVQRLVPRLVASLDHAVALATNTLRYGRADERAPERRLLLLRGLADEAGEAAASGLAELKFENGIDPALEIDADPEQLFRILLNLLRNAVDALGARGGTIEVAASRKARQVTIELADDGPGIPDAVRARLFQPFSGSTRSGGSGLGLAIARDLARAHGGDLILVSTGAAGTRFRIDIPDREDR
jgi:signal transduction histidine kinase